MDGDAHIAMIHHQPCSGGTIICRAIASMAGVALLSEVHPDLGLGRKGIPLKQAESAYGIVTRADVHACFVAQIHLIHERCAQSGMSLVLRDHYAADFLSEDFRRLTSVEVLEREFSLRRIFTVRHPVDVWLGLKDRDWIGVPIEQYLERALATAHHAAKSGFEQYEDFVAEPDAVLARLSSRLGIPFDDDWRRGMERVSHMTGASGRTSEEIAPRPRRSISDDDMGRFQGSPVYSQVLDMLGYSH